MKAGKRKSAVKARQVVLEAVRRTTKRKRLVRLPTTIKKSSSAATKKVTTVTKKRSPISTSQKVASPVLQKEVSGGTPGTKKVAVKDIEVIRKIVRSPISTCLDLRLSSITSKHTISGRSSVTPQKKTTGFPSPVFTQVEKERNPSPSLSETSPGVLSVSRSSKRIASKDKENEETKSKTRSQETYTGRQQPVHAANTRGRKMSSSSGQEVNQKSEDRKDKAEEDRTTSEERQQQIDSIKTNAEEKSDVRTAKDHPVTPRSPKKLKGSLAVKFKSWNWTKQDQIRRSKENVSEEPFESSEGEVDEEEMEANKSPIIVEQNNQRLYKCQKCLLYIPQENFNYHEMESCEALHTSHGCEYTCSECLATYPSQKLLVRHKRECPKRSQSMYRNKSPRDGKGLEGMYSVVWKCHCKESFKCSEDLEKHRLNCKFAQNYTVPCPICNMRIMGGHRTLRYHMSKNHPSLFLPDESSTSCILNSLQNSSPSQVITTQTANIDKLVKQLSKEHSGASIRVVTVPKDGQKTSSKQQETEKSVKKDATSKPVAKKTTETPKSKPEDEDVENDPSDESFDDNEVEKTAVQKKQLSRTANLSAVTKVDAEEVADTSEGDQVQHDVTEASSETNTKRRQSSRRSTVASQSRETPETDTEAKPIEPEGKAGKVKRSDSVDEPPVKRVRVSQRNKDREEAKQKATETVEPKTLQKPSAGTKVSDTSTKGTDSAAAKETSISQTTPVEYTPKTETKKEKRDDLQDLLQKARALTKELEEKLAKSESGNEHENLSLDMTVTSVSSDLDTSMETQEEEVTKPNAAKKQTVKRKPTVTTRSPVAKKVRSEADESPEGSPDNAGGSRISKSKPGRQYSNVTSLDSSTVLKDHVELGNHKQFHGKGRDLDGGRMDDVEVCVGESEKPKMDVSECYYCTMCKSKFSLRSQLYTHMRDAHKYEGLHMYLNFHCPYCPRVFQTMKLRQAHKTDRHLDILKSTGHEEEYFVQGQETCDKCFAIFPKSELLMHDEKCEENIKQEEKGSFCQLCGVVMIDDEELKVHRQQSHLTAVHFRCGQCSRTFGHALELRCHKVSHHSRSQKMEQVYREVKRLETQKNVKLAKSIKIHISPSTPVKDATVKGNSFTPQKRTQEKVQPTKMQVSKSVKEPAISKTPARTAASKTPVSDKIVKTGKGPLSLTKEQMSLLSKGKSIKLVLPKDTDMKRLSFAVPSADGKTKKFSLSPKPETGSGTSGKPEGEGTETSNGHVAEGAGDDDEQTGRKSPQPQQVLAAALGLQPTDPANPTKATAKHRPTRLRSGRTIESAPQTAVPPKKDKDESHKTGKEVTKQVAEQVSPSSKESSKAETAAKETTVLKLEGKEESSKENGEELKVTQSPSEVESTSKREPSPKPESNENTTTKVKDSGNLPPVQVLKPLGNDRVQCMRCNRILASMMEVANHQCDLENADSPPVPSVPVKTEPSVK